MINANGFTNWTWTILEFDIERERSAILLEHIHSEDTPYIDFLAVGAKGTGMKKYTELCYIGKVAKKLIEGSVANVVITN